MILEGLTALVAPWASFYSDHAIVRTGVTFVHVGGLLTSGGLALASDRAVLRATEADRPLRLADLGTTHRTVVVGLGLVMLSGALLLLADLETYLTSWVFWTKMGLVLLLLGNGLMLLKAEQALERSPEWDGGWARLRRRALASVSLWLLITLIGTALVNLS
jgi:uncharacterized membrane protein